MIHETLKKKKTMKKIYVFLVIALTLTLLVCGFLSAVKVSHYGNVRVTDGFGRQLEPTPVYAKLLLEFDSAWPGLTWVIIDRLIFLGLAWPLIRFLKILVLDPAIGKHSDIIPIDPPKPCYVYLNNSHEDTSYSGIKTPGVITGQIKMKRHPAFVYGRKEIDMFLVEVEGKSNYYAKSEVFYN
jgi:hypothetical protein